MLSAGDHRRREGREVRVPRTLSRSWRCAFLVVYDGTRQLGCSAPGRLAQLANRALSSGVGCDAAISSARPAPEDDGVQRYADWAVARPGRMAQPRNA